MRNVYISILMLLLTAGTQVSALAQDNMSEANRASRRIAVALPKVAPSLVKPVVLTPKREEAAVKTKTSMDKASAASSTTKLNPETEFASHPYSPKEKKPEDGLKSAIIDSASKAELISRSYNRRLADLIVWLANSMQSGTSYTPQASYFKPFSQATEKHVPPVPVLESRQQIVQID